MELQVLVSKKGTKVVTATNLHMVLELPNHHYATNVRKWLNDIYEFRDGIRKPVRLRDFATRRNKENPIVDDYYLSVELAKLITLNSRSRVKQKYANRLLSLEDKEENAALLTKEQVQAVLELTRAMSLVSCQEASERRHLEVYAARNGGTAANWWKHRAEVLGYSVEALREKFREVSRNLRGKSRRQILMKMDKHEMIRAGIIDLFMALGKSESYARHIGDLAKVFARECEVDVYDDRRPAAAAPAPRVNAKLVQEVKALETGGVLSLW